MSQADLSRPPLGVWGPVCYKSDENPLPPSGPGPSFFPFPMSFALALGRIFGNRLSATAAAHVPAAATAATAVSTAAGSLRDAGIGVTRVLRPGIVGVGLRMLSSSASSALPRLPVFEAIARHDPDSTVVIHSGSGRRFRYGELLGDVCRTRNRLYEAVGRTDIDGERIAFLVENSYDYVGKPIIVPQVRPRPG